MVAWKELAERLEGVSHRIQGLKPYSSLEKLKELSEAEVEHAYKCLDLRYQILNERVESIFDLDADRREFQMALDRLQLRCPKDMIEKFQDGDIIEVYDLNFVQLYHNWVFHYYCSYDLLTLLTQPIWQLYSRPKEMEERLVQRAKEVASEARGPVRWDVPLHYLKETQLQTPRVFEIDLQWICPIWDVKGRTVGVVSTNQCTPKSFTVV